MPTIKMKVPVDRSGEIHCTAPQQSRTVYKNLVPGAIIEVDTRDLSTFYAAGFKTVEE